MNPHHSRLVIDNQPNSVLLETIKAEQEDKKTLFFSNPVEVILANSVNEIVPAFQKMELALRDGFYLAGYLTYECGYHFEELQASHDYQRPLLWFGVYTEPLTIDDSMGIHDSSGEYSIHGLRFSISAEGEPANLSGYSQKISKIKHHIQEGDVYQVNVTGRMRFKGDGSPLALYDALKKKQRVGYAAYIQTEEQTILSLSPELFFKREGDKITVRPMKGTAKRGRTLNEDEAIKSWLVSDMKSRAENVMIVDVLRNDLGKLAEFGSVKTTGLYEIEKYETLFQMVSNIEARLPGTITYYELFRSLFPCGSVTGAPKRRAMQIIQELEPTPRGIYTGAIGYIAPDKRAVFNVAIRTVVLERDINKDDNGTMGTGGGIVWDSNAEEELRECELKAQFLSTSYEEFKLIETMLWHNGFPLLDLHLQRLKESCEYFDFVYDQTNIVTALNETGNNLQGSKRCKVRLTLDRAGIIDILIDELQDMQNKNLANVTIAAERTNSSDRFLFHKTTRRKLYDELYQRAVAKGFADVIFLNEREEVTEGAISNIVIKNGDVYCTPPIECGLLNGVYRRHLLKTLSNIEERALFKRDLKDADSIYLCNAVRGMREVKLVLP